MSCFNPLYAWKSFDKSTGKNKIHIIPRRVDTPDKVRLKEIYGDDFLELPCGKCEACLESYARNWAYRCVLEASCYDNNSFVTLTYDPRHYPEAGLVKDHVRDFIKRLRNRFGSGIRYFGCGEYGSNTFRGHYHLILFNWWPDDAVAVGRSSDDSDFLYQSKILSELWPFGFASIGHVSVQSCNYVARYCTKKLKRDQGVIVKTPEFIMMSNHPGIGYQYFSEHYQEIYDTDKIYHMFGNNPAVSPMRYFDKLFESIDSKKLEEVKTKRISKANVSAFSSLFQKGFNHFEEYYHLQRQKKNTAFKKLERMDL